MNFENSTVHIHIDRSIDRQIDRERDIDIDIDVDIDIDRFIYIYIAIINQIEYFFGGCGIYVGIMLDVGQLKKTVDRIFFEAPGGG